MTDNEPNSVASEHFAMCSAPFSRTRGNRQKRPSLAKRGSAKQGSAKQGAVPRRSRNIISRSAVGRSAIGLSALGLSTLWLTAACDGGELGSPLAPSAPMNSAAPSTQTFNGQPGTMGANPAASAGTQQNSAANPTGALPSGNVTDTSNPSGQTASSVAEQSDACLTPEPGRAPLRRLTRFEYNNSIADLLGDTTEPANALPPELLGNGYGNDADEQPTSSLLVEQYGSVASNVAERVLASPELLSPSCVSPTGAVAEQACVDAVLDGFVTRAFRRPLEMEERNDLIALQQSVAQITDFEDSLSALIETVLQAPDFLYRLEWGVPDTASPTTLRPSGYEMATRLSYLYWGTVPDDQLWAAADSGELMGEAGVRTQAERLLSDDRALPVIRYFFDHFLPINTLTDLARDASEFPTFSPSIGALMRNETHEFLRHEIFEGPGDWGSVLTAPYTFVNEELANFYGIPGVTGDEFQRVDVDPTKRLGLLTQGAILAGTTISNFTNPVRRGVFILRDMMCIPLPPPPATVSASVIPPDPYSANTGRERFSIHSEQPECAACHAVMDPPGFALENYDAVGLWRDQENGETIDASGNVAAIGEFSGPIELVNLIATNEQTHACFAENWMDYAYGRSLDETTDACTVQQLQSAFTASGHNIQELLLGLTQTDAFLYLSAPEAL